jgi:glycosyltransferase involved in cell wall biosynthesis
VNILQTIFYSLAALCTLSWLLYLLRAAYHGASIKLLRSEETPPLNDPPKISIIIAARNEEALIDHSLRSILQTIYPNVELVAVNDRSTDATGAILDTLASEDDRIKVIHVTELPEGWLGKVHALHTGTQHATGDWLLFTDADIHFAPEVLSKAVAYAEAHTLDQLSILPDDRTQHQGFYLPLFISAFGGLFLQRLKVKHVTEGRKGAFIGVGAFNLIRRSAFDRTPGFEWLRMEVIDDVGVGYMISQIDGQIAVLHGEKLLSFEWYPSLGDAIKGLEKNAFAGFARYNVARGLWVSLSMAAVVLLPFIVTIAYRDLTAFAIILSIYSIIPAIGVIVIGKAVNIRPILAATLPLGYLFVAVAILNSTLKGWKDHGLRWRDTFYPLEALRKGKRVEI